MKMTMVAIVKMLVIFHVLYIIFRLFISETLERCTEDLESGSQIEGQTIGSSLKAPISIIIPIFRRDSHLEVIIYCNPT